jgi:gas vesicle protein
MARDRFDDERVVIIERDNGGSSVGLLLLGLAVGAGAALLLAPASGAETRERLSREARRASQRVKDLTDELGEKLADQVEQARHAVDDRVTRARDAVSTRVQAVNEAVAASRDAASQARADIERAVEHSKQAYADSRRVYGEKTRRAASGEPGPVPDDLSPSQGAEGAADRIPGDA